MKNILALGGLALASAALAQTCPVILTGTAKLADAHHVAYSVTVTNPSARPIAYNARLDFFLKGAKIPGGFENIVVNLPAKGKKTITGSEPFVEKLTGVDQVKATRIRSCK